MRDQENPKWPSINLGVKNVTKSIGFKLLETIYGAKIYFAVDKKNRVFVSLPKIELCHISLRLNCHSWHFISLALILMSSFFKYNASFCHGLYFLK